MSVVKGPDENSWCTSARTVSPRGSRPAKNGPGAFEKLSVRWPRVSEPSDTM